MDNGYDINVVDNDSNDHASDKPYTLAYLSETNHQLCQMQR